MEAAASDASTDDGVDARGRTVKKDNAEGPEGPTEEPASGPTKPVVHRPRLSRCSSPPRVKRVSNTDNGRLKKRLSEAGFTG